MQGQHVTSTVTNPEPLTSPCVTDGYANSTLEARNGKIEHERYKTTKRQESVGHQGSAEDQPEARAYIRMEQSDKSEHILSQDQDGTSAERHGDREKKDEDKKDDEVDEGAEEVEEHKTLDYQIPEDVLRAAMLASTNTRASFWSAKMYRGPDGESLSTHYCRSLEVAERVAQKFLEVKVVGFDIEWRPFSPVKNIKQNASLIQLACEDRIALFHVALFEGTTPEQLMPPSLKAILESPDILKVGVAVKGDFSRLKRYLNIQAQGVFELSRLHNLVEWHAKDPDKVSNKLVALAVQVLQHLQLPLYKGAPLEDDPVDTENVRESDWSKPLNLQQIHYAATDAYAGFRLYHLLEWKRKQLRPTPPTRGLCDYDAIAVSRAKLPKKKAISKSKDALAAAVEESEPVIEQEQDETDQEDGYETAPEELLDSHDLEDPSVSTSAGTAHAAEGPNENAGADVATQKRVGRVNLSWLRGSDPGYPTLPQDSKEYEHATPSHSFDYETACARIGENVATSGVARLPQFDADTEMDEFADPELEEALQIMELDADGKLKEAASAATTGIEAAVTSVPAQPLVSASLTQVAADETTARRVGLSLPDNEDTDAYFEKHDLTPADGEAQEPTRAPTPAFKPLAIPTDETSHSPEYDLATTWARGYLQSTIPSPTSTAPSRIRATIPHLRAYHLWHHQNLSLDDIASHLRAKPLSHNTVTGYILQAVSLERLEYDKEAMKAMMMDMPTGLRKGRWKWMAEKVGALR
jgi:hypothetical protein